LERFAEASSSVQESQYSTSPLALNPLWHVLNSPDVHWRSKGVSTKAGPESMVTLDLGTWKFRYQSPPLTGSELLDLAESEKELEHGRGKRFKDPKALLEDLDS
jgi:hypothetical protein